MNNSELLHAYLDNEMTPLERARFEEQLAKDAELRAQLVALRGVDEALGAWEEIEPTGDFVDRVVAAAQPARGRLVRLWAPWAAVAAAAVLAVIVWPRGSEAEGGTAVFSQEERLAYVWEDDDETYGSLAMSDLEDAILEELDAA